MDVPTHSTAPAPRQAWRQVATPATLTTAATPYKINSQTTGRIYPDSCAAAMTLINKFFASPYVSPARDTDGLNALMDTIQVRLARDDLAETARTLSGQTCYIAKFQDVVANIRELVAIERKRRVTWGGASGTHSQ